MIGIGTIRINKTQKEWDDGPKTHEG